MKKIFPLPWIPRVKVIFILIPLFIASCQENQPILETVNPLLRNSNQVIDFAQLSPENISKAASTVIEQAEGQLKIILAVKDRDFENTMRDYDRLNNSIYRTAMPLELLMDVHPDSVIREACKKAHSELKNFLYGLEINEDLYIAIKAYSNTDDAIQLIAHKKKFLNDIILEYKRSGFDLDSEKRKTVKELKTIIDRLGKEFSSNVAASTSNFIEITPEQADGLDTAYLNARKTENGTYKIDVTYPSIGPFFKYCKNELLRKELLTLYYNRGVPENVIILDSVLYYRHQLAKTLGYNTFAEYAFEDKMAQNPKTVWDFENSLIEMLREKAREDYDKILETKSKYLQTPAKQIKAWEKNFYTQILKEQEYQLDDREVRNYFEFNNVLEGLFQITQSLLGLRYEEVKNPSVWHPDVRMFNCYDTKSDKLIGRFYLDMFPRENKYSHAAMFTITGGMALENDGYEMPEAALVCNFPKPEGDNPSLLFHSNVGTFFHEFGHLLHCLVSKAELSAQSGPETVVLDFVEAPSQIYENWAWQKQTLSIFAKHYKTGEMIPDELLDKMIAVKHLNSGIDAKRQMFYGTYALTVHDRYIPYGENNTTIIGYKLRQEITGFEMPENSHFEASFGHLIGYTAGYYSYMWSKVYAQDMWSIFEEKGILNPEIGREYRQKVLEPSGSIEPLELVKNFLGREPNNKALLKDLGLRVK